MRLSAYSMLMLGALLAVLTISEYLGPIVLPIPGNYMIMVAEMEVGGIILGALLLIIGGALLIYSKRQKTSKKGKSRSLAC